MKEVLTLIKKYEGFSSVPYYATPYEKSKGLLTIGYGFTNIDGSPIKENQNISEEKAEEILKEKIIDLIKKCRLSEYDEKKQASLVSFIFNVGIGNWNNSTLKRKIERNKSIILEKQSTEYNKVLNYFEFCGIEPVEKITEFHRWSLQNGKILKGLLRRRIEESNLFLRDIC